MKNKYIIGIGVLILLVLLLFISGKFLDSGSTKNDDINSSNNTSDEKQEFDYLLEGYPEVDVPLYKIREVSSSKYYINFDPKNISYFDDTNYTYYNVVFYTDASQSEFLNYYKELFDKEYVEEYANPEMVKGYVGKYRVTAAHYGSDDTGYVQVYLPNEEFTKDNKYFVSYPDLFEEDSMLVEHENSYGLLNQTGGQTEYTRYFTVIDSGDRDKDGKDDVDEFAVLISKYENIYKDKLNYTMEGEQMSWEDGGYKITVSFSKDHGRVYLNIRGGIKE
ncbi:MAG TPA: hypothetical protein PLD77_01575 [Candidatus Dojkabacteria bacterium]|nr:hypothetical protein [Candidatus Dojkabacteria bacterium]